MSTAIVRPSLLHRILPIHKSSLNTKIATPLALFDPEFQMEFLRLTKEIQHPVCCTLLATSTTFFAKNQKPNIFTIDPLTRYNLELLLLCKLP